MNDGYYLSTYLHIDELAHLMDLRLRHDQNISLWKKSGEDITLVHYWELERITGIKRHNKSFFSVEQAKDVINLLLKEYDLTMEDMVQVWGTPQLQTCDDYHSLKEYKNLSYHSIAHLFSSIMFDTDVFYNGNIIGLAVDGGPDSVVDMDVNLKNYYSGCVVLKGNVEVFPVYSPGFIWSYARKRYKLREGTLMALATASESEAFIVDDDPLLVKGISDLKRAFKYVQDLADRVESFTDADQGVLFNKFDDRFSIEDNKISMVMKEIQRISIKIMELNLDKAIDEYGVKPGDTYLALSGGYVLNCPTNSYLMEKYGFKGFVAPPCVSDTGLSMGIALYAFYKHMGKFRFKMQHAYYGDRDNSLDSLLQKELYREFIKEVTDIDMGQAVEDIQAAPLVWINDAAEVGPRALGNRSILADPRKLISKDRLNEVKQRQWWRPVAPIVLEEDVGEWFENSYPAPFMLQTFKIKDNKKDLIPAVSHLDSSARVQTVNSSDNPLLHTLIKAFKERTGVSILCNTSLNDREEPIINRIEEALNFALRKNINIVYANGKRVLLRNHSNYKVEKPLKRPVDIQVYANEEEKNRMIKEYNPYGIHKDALMMYCMRPDLRRDFNLSNKDDARKLEMYSRLVLDKIGLASMPGV